MISIVLKFDIISYFISTNPTKKSGKEAIKTLKNKLHLSTIDLDMIIGML